MVPRPEKVGRSSRRDTSALPATLLKNLPTCARECVSTSVNDSFVPSQCNNASDAECLCSHYSTSGYSLGELSLSCLYANCPSSTRNESSHEVFNVCSGYSSAVTATHSVLTLTTSRPASSSTIPVTTSTSGFQSAHTTLSSTIRTTQSQQVTTATITTSPTINPTSSETTATSSATPTPSASGLTTGQAIGVSVASIGIVGLTIGLLILCCCLRRRRKAESTTKKSVKSKHSSFDFVDKSPPNSPFRGSHKALARPQEEWWRNTGLSYPEINRVSSGHKSHRASILPSFQILQKSRNNIGDAQSQGPQRHSFKIPASSLNKRNTGRPSRPASSATGMTMFEEDCKSPLDKKTLPRPPCLPRPVFLPPISPNPGPSFADQYTTSPEDMYQPSLSLKIPSMPLEHDELPLPRSLALISPSTCKAAHISMPPSSAVSYLPAYYTSNDSRTPVVPGWSPPSEGSRFSQPQYVPKPLTSRVIRSSFASDTTFESLDPDEATPENEDDKQLSPISYPKVPRPSNQAIPRSPPQTMSPRLHRFSPTARREPTLIAKRRGDNMAHDLERGLMITNINGSFKTKHYTAASPTNNTRELPDSPLKGYEKGSNGRTSSSKGDTPQLEMKSPLWEPKLTPSRRGGDLYLQVELKKR